MSLEEIGRTQNNGNSVLEFFLLLPSLSWTSRNGERKERGIGDVTNLHTRNYLKREKTPSSYSPIRNKKAQTGSNGEEKRRMHQQHHQPSSHPLLPAVLVLLITARAALGGNELRVHNASELIDLSRNVSLGTSFERTTVFLDEDIDLSRLFEPIRKGPERYFRGTPSEAS